ncbi:MAG TPA: UDP-N-acetylglucosamine 2-epimerase (non-hydrolyzing) [Prolixibacteraceae bacterium]|nr:UDP-N-acetylglucosamine 2-epimerase (non-hydrolyzing) [Prolixibacteraceae bacterium]
MKVMTIVGTRPEIIKMSRVMAELEKYVDHVLVHTGQNYDYELNEIFFENLGVRKPDYFLDVAGKNVAYTIGNVIAKSDDVFEIEKPDAVLLYGDTNSCLAVISAKRRKIPVFHFEAGNRCFDQRVPEELNRKVLDHLSDINFPLTEHARRYLLAEGIKPDTIIKPGSPMKEILDFHAKSITDSKILKTLGLEENKFFIVSTHREENVDSAENFNDFLDSLNAIAEKYQYPVIVSTHPRTKIKLESLKRTDLNPLIQFLKPMGFFDYNKMQQNAFCCISDSGTISEESSIMNFPAITIRQAHERPEGMDEGTLIMSGLKKDRILQSIDIIVSQFSKVKRVTKIVNDYNVDNFSLKVVRAVISYVDYVNRTVWKK